MFNKEKYLPLTRDIPVAISHLCCSKMKKSPIKAYQRKNGYVPFLGTLAEESRIRKQAWIRHGCNAFESKSPTSQPLSFWTEQDILKYIVMYRDAINNERRGALMKHYLERGFESINDVEAVSGLTVGELIEKELESPIAAVYGDIVAVDKFGNEYDPYNTLIPDCTLKCTGCDRTGCVYCGFGFHNERGETRFQRLAKTHPRQYEYCIGGGQWVDNPAYDPTAPKFDGEWQNWNPKKIWVPSKKGLGMGKVFDMCNEIYGKSFMRYE